MKCGITNRWGREKWKRWCILNKKGHGKKHNRIKKIWKCKNRSDNGRMNSMKIIPKNLTKNLKRHFKRLKKMLEKQWTKMNRKSLRTQQLISFLLWWMILIPNFRIANFYSLWKMSKMVLLKLKIMKSLRTIKKKKKCSRVRRGKAKIWNFD